MRTDRIRLLALVYLVPLIFIVGRVVYLQFGLGPWHRAMMVDAEVSVRPIRAPRGSITAFNGTVLATDRCDADLAVHYRYLERPLDRDWLVRTARARLPRKLRKDEERVEQEAVRLGEEVLGMWQALAELSAVPVSELDQRAGAVQRRVERIAESVNRRRQERWRQSSAESDRNDPGSNEIRAIEPNSLDRTSLHTISRACAWLADEPKKPIVHRPPEDISIIEHDRYFLLVKNISPAALIEFTTYPERFPGVRLEQRIRRIYPERDIACSVIGYINPLGEESSFDGPSISSGSGLTGIEGYYDHLLTGSAGWVRERRRWRDGVPQVLGGRPPQPGQDITLTLDLRLQQYAERLLDEARVREAGGGSSGAASSGVAILLDIRTGAVLAAASSPRFDLNLASDPGSEAAQQLAARADSPLFNRIVQMTLAPGSTFKPVTALAALKSGIHIHETYHCRGYLRRPDQHRCLIYRNAGAGHDTITMHEALVRSCNVYFFQLAERLGAEPILHWGELLGLGQATGVDLAGERTGALVQSMNPNPGRHSMVRPESQTDALGLAIGQGTMEVTPLQVAVMMAAVANGGHRVIPHVRWDAFQPPRPITGLTGPSDVSLGAIRGALEQVVASHQGTGHDYVRLPDVAIAGKTGTAQSGSPRGDHAWFAGYAPAGRPRVAIVVVLEHAGSGAHGAGPIAREMIRRMAELGYFEVEALSAGR